MTDPNAQITVEHIEQACEWAKRAFDNPHPLDGFTRQYDQEHWDCGTSCCIWGAAHLLARGVPTNEGPPAEWASDAQRKLLRALMLSGTSTPEMFEPILHGVDLHGANLHDADLHDADLHDANLHDADLRGANLHGAWVSVGNTYRQIKE